MCAFAVAPAIVSATAPGRLIVDFLEPVLTHIADHERSRSPMVRIVEGIAPGISQTECPYFGSSSRRPRRNEWIVCRNLVSSRVGIGHVHVDSQHLAEQFPGILSAVCGIVPRATVTEPDVEISVRSEHEVAAVVVRKRLRDETRTAGAPSKVETRRGIRHR